LLSIELADRPALFDCRGLSPRASRLGRYPSHPLVRNPRVNSHYLAVRTQDEWIKFWQSGSLEPTNAGDPPPNDRRHHRSISRDSYYWLPSQALNPAAASDPPIRTVHVYDAVTGWLNSITAGAGGSTNGLQNEAYLYDEVGNVSQRQNNNLGLTENFSYDGVNRLSTSQLNGSPNLSMTYATNGDIVSRSDVASGAAWTYDPSHIHRVTQAGSSAFTYSYDGNGNVSARNGSIIGWTSYNYTDAVTTSTESATFDYGPDRQRWRMVYSGPSGVETTYYATPMFEAVATGGVMDYRHYIFANDRPVLLISHTNAGAVDVRSLLINQHNSISTIASNSTGAAYATESFTPYGSRREASTWIGAPTSGELTTMNGVTREGYTLQTVLGSMGLNHMNGRIEDSVTGRFLSPDPRGTIRGNTQSWNRYSYVNNNPLTFTDPTGFAVVPYCQDFCPGANWHPAPFAFSSWGNSSSGLEGMVGTNSTYGNNNNTIDLAALTASLNATSAAMTAAVNKAFDDALAAALNGASTSTGDTSAQSEDSLDPITVTAQRQTSNDQIQAITVTAQRQSNGSDSASAFFTALGMGAAGVELKYGESFLGTPNGRLYPRAWANGAGRTVRIGALTKAFGWVGLGVGTAFDYDSWQAGEIDQTQFNVNLGLGTLSMFSPAAPILLSPYIFINSTYPGGLGQWMLDHPEAMMPIAAGYMGD